MDGNGKGQTNRAPSLWPKPSARSAARASGRYFNALNPAFQAFQQAQPVAQVLPVGESSNLATTEGELLRRADALAQQQAVFVRDVNAKLAYHVSVMPWQLIPTSIWHGEFGHFIMMACDFYPASPENTILLPANDYSAAATGLPVHPREVTPDLEQDAYTLLQAFHSEFAAEHLRIAAALARGDLSSVYSSEERRQRYSANLRQLAQSLGVTAFGAEAFALHKQVFGAMLGWPQA